MAYTNSSLVSYTKLSPNHSGTRNHAIDTISIHCVVGQLSVETIGDLLAKPTREASCNYAIGSDGRIALIVEEKNRSWCTSSSSNDNRAITIEVACDITHPYAVNDKVYASLIKLCADICKRNGIEKLLWEGDKNLIGNIKRQNMTVHRWFKNKACPGDYLYNRHGQIAAEVNALLGVKTDVKTEAKAEANKLPAVPFTVEVLVDDLHIRSKASMSGKIKGDTGKGVFTIVDTKDGWGKLKSKAGWIYLENPEYCKVLDSVKEEPKKEEPKKEEPKDTSFKVKVEITNLNIRKGPGTNHDRTGKFTGVGVFTIVNVKSGTGSEAGWGELKSGEGWISLDFAKRL